MDIIVAYCEPWNTPLRTSKHHYIERLAAAEHRILYVEMPANPLSILRRPRDFFGDTLGRLRAGVRLVARNVWAMTGIFPLPYHRGFNGVFDKLWLNNINQKKFLPRLVNAIGELSFQQPIVLNYFPLIFPVLDAIQPSRTVFHLVDEWQGLSGVPHSMAELTRGMMQRADTTIVSSRRLLERYQGYAREIHLLRHGTDLKLFAPVAEDRVHADQRLSAFPGVKVGYYGALHKLDFDLIRDVALTKPEWFFIFLGPKSGAQGFRPFIHLPSNVLILDPWNREALPGFLAGLDVFWMPFLRNELTHSMCPIKLFEVLSSGVAIVSADLDEIRDAGGAQLEYATNPSEHVAALERSLAFNGPKWRQARAAAVSNYDWSARMAVFSELLFGGAP